LSGDRTSYDHFWPRIKSAGLAFVLCSYRIFQEAPFPAAYQDLLAVLKWLAKNGAGYQLDAGRCALLGGSAGGHLAMLLGLRAAREETGICHVRAVVDYCGIMNLADQFQADQKRGSTMTLDFMGGTPAEKSLLYREASPVFHIHRRAPAIWIAHGDKDQVVPFEQSRRMVEALERNGLHPVFLKADGRGHTLTAEDDMPKDKVKFLFEKEMLEFLNTHLAG